MLSFVLSECIFVLLPDFLLEVLLPLVGQTHLVQDSISLVRNMFESMILFEGDLHLDELDHIELIELQLLIFVGYLERQINQLLN